ncbi:hypothetical protein MG296_01245 [Flavobacteriaceae bacterium TK19130]|nr:hypothetical protein [Thermobacterium salinum]
MLLVYCQKATPRITYVFKHVVTRILGVEVGFTSVIEELIAHNGPKMSYGKQPMGNEMFVQSAGLLEQSGVESIEIIVSPWENTIGFFKVGEKSILPYDIFSAAFYLLSRYEEYLPHVKDEKGRYPATESLGYKEKFLETPVIDIWAQKFKEVLHGQFPSLSIKARDTRTHHVIKADKPFAYGQKGIFRSMIGYLSDLVRFRFSNLYLRTQVLLRLRKDPYDTFTWLVNIGKQHRKSVTVFFLLGDALQFEDSLNTKRRQFQMKLKFVGDYYQVGTLFSFAALQQYSKLKSEKKFMEAITNRPLQASMNAEYVVDLPDIYRELIELEIIRDFTMVYNTHPGFRAGTCTPFLFYDLDYEIKTPLEIQPLAMTTQSMAGKTPAQVRQKVENMYREVFKVGGLFSMVYSNTDFAASEPSQWKKIFTETLQHL